MTRLNFDVENPDLDALRQVVLARLRDQSGWKQIGVGAIDGFGHLVELTPPRANDRTLFDKFILQMFWELTLEGVIVPGIDPHQSGFPWFSVTPYGRRVLVDREYVPHDRRGFLELLQERVQHPDATVLAYLDESLQTFARNNLVASTVMLGIASERVFDLVCESVLQALDDSSEAKQFAERLERNPMNPKLRWLHDKLSRLRVKDLPENVTLTVTTIYDLLRVQRNDLGHPRDAPPRPSRSQAYANLLVFPPYYERAEAFRAFLTSNKI